MASQLQSILESMNKSYEDLNNKQAEFLTADPDPTRPARPFCNWIEPHLFMTLELHPRW